MDPKLYAILSAIAITGAIIIVLTQIIVGGDSTFSALAFGGCTTLAGTLAGRGSTSA